MIQFRGRLLIIPEHPTQIWFSPLWSAVALETEKNKTKMGNHRHPDTVLAFTAQPSYSALRL